MEAGSDHLAPGTAMSNSRLLWAYLTEAKFDLVRALRAPGFSVPILLLPVALYLLFGAVFFGDALRCDPKVALFAFTGFAIMGVMGPGMFGFGIFVATDREQGLISLKRALPMPPAAYLRFPPCNGENDARNSGRGYAVDTQESIERPK